MKPKFGITSKLLIWFFFFISIFFGTILILFMNIQQIVIISENIVNNNFEISYTSKKMIENLLSMEESEKKYLFLFIQEQVSIEIFFCYCLKDSFDRGTLTFVGTWHLQ